MQQVGSLQNLIYSGATKVVPQVGMGATLIYWTDREPYTIIEVSKSGKRIKIQSDNWKRVDNNGLSESQDYKYEKNPNGAIRVASLRKDGTWKMVGGSQSVLVGQRLKYEDPCY